MSTATSDAELIDKFRRLRRLLPDQSRFTQGGRIGQPRPQPPRPGDALAALPLLAGRPRREPVPVGSDALSCRPSSPPWRHGVILELAPQTSLLSGAAGVIPPEVIDAAEKARPCSSPISAAPHSLRLAARRGRTAGDDYRRPRHGAPGSTRGQAGAEADYPRPHRQGVGLA